MAILEPLEPVEPVEPLAGIEPSGPRPVRPDTLTLAMRLMYAGAAAQVITLIGTLVTLSTVRSDVHDRLQRNNPDFTESDFSTLWRGTIILQITIFVIGALLWAWMAWANGRGRYWARVTATCFALIYLTYALLAVIAGAGGVIYAGLVASLLIGIAALVCMYLPRSTDYYFALSGRRR